MAGQGDLRRTGEDQRWRRRCACAGPGWRGQRRPRSHKLNYLPILEPGQATLTGQAQIKDDPGVAPFDRAILLTVPGDAVTFSVPGGGHLGLVLVEHGWSGTVEVAVGRARYQVDLYSPVQRSRVFEVVLPALRAVTAVTIRLIEGRNPASLDCQAWIYGAFITDDAADQGLPGRARRLVNRALKAEPTQRLWARTARSPLVSPPSPPPQEVAASTAPPPWAPDGHHVIPIGQRLTFVHGIEADLLTLNADVGISEEIRRTGVWAVRDVELFKSVVKPGMVVLDIGANLGHHTVLFSHLVGASGNVAAFEPQRVMFGLLETNVFLNGCHNVDAFRLALGETAGEVTMWPADYSTPTNFGAVGVFDRRGSWTPGSPGETVTLATIDDHMSRWAPDRKVDFMKIDVQAFELPCLRGASALLRRDRPIIFLEISPYWMKNLVGYDYREVFQLLSQLGYTVYEPHRSLTEASTREWSGEQLEEWDVLAVPEGWAASGTNS